MSKLKRNYANSKNKNISHADREKKKNIWKIIIIKEKNSLNHLINSVEELENVYLNK